MLNKRFVFVVQALITLLQAKFLLLRGGWPVLVKRLPPLPDGCKNTSTHHVDQILQYCETAARLLPVKTECLERSFMTCSVLRRSGVFARLCVGVSRVPPIRFHAWTQVEGNTSSSLSFPNYNILCRL